MGWPSPLRPSRWISTASRMRVRISSRVSAAATQPGEIGRSGRVACTPIGAPAMLARGQTDAGRYLTVFFIHKTDSYA